MQKQRLFTAEEPSAGVAALLADVFDSGVGRGAALAQHLGDGRQRRLLLVAAQGSMEAGRQQRLPNATKRASFKASCGPIRQFGEFDALLRIWSAEDQVP